MKKIIPLLAALCFGFGSRAQILVIGNNYLNGTPLSNVHVTVKADGVITQTLDTKTKNEFQVEVNFGKVYKVYLEHEKCVTMYFEIVGNTVPKSKYDFMMSHSFDLPFVNKNDPDIDTTAFQNPFYKIVFDGKKRMEDDTAYSAKFNASLVKKHPKPTEPQPESLAVAKPPAEASVFAGKIFLNNDKLRPVKNKTIVALDAKGSIVKSTSTNRFGAFAFTGIKPSDIAKIRMDLSGSEKNEMAEYTNGNLGLYNTKAILLQLARPVNDACIWTLTSKGVESLADDEYTSNIGGKLVSSSAKEKKFFANKTVYLSNRLNTVIQRTKTNMLGSFVFEDLKPDNVYFVGVDNADLIPGERIDILTKDDSYIATLDSVRGGKTSVKLNSDYNNVFNKMTIMEDEMKMDIRATIFGDNVNHPIGKLKIVLLNDSYQPIDSVITNDYGAFKFKYLPFLKRFYLTAENTDNVLDVYKNILIYSSDQSLVKVMTHQKGKKFTYNPVSGELNSLRDIELEDPWLEFVDTKDRNGAKKPVAGKPKSIMENILFETNKSDITPEAREVLDKIVLVMNTNKELKIEIGAHTDSKGSESDNMKLSEMRAKTVKDYMTASGINGSRISTKGYGESKLLNNCRDGQYCDESEHAKNRRIEFKILGE